MDHKGIADHVMQCLLHTIEQECMELSRRSKPVSPFRKMDPKEYTEFEWKKFVDAATRTAPTLLQIFSSVVSHSDQRNKKKVGQVHFPGICMSLSILLKERNREMCGVQSIISLLLYSSHADKQVNIHT